MVISGAGSVEKPRDDHRQDSQGKSEARGVVNERFHHIEERAEVAGSGFIDLGSSGVID